MLMFPSQIKYLFLILFLLTCLPACTGITAYTSENMQAVPAEHVDNYKKATQAINSGNDKLALEWGIQAQTQAESEFGVYSKEYEKTLFILVDIYPYAVTF